MNTCKHIALIAAVSFFASCTKNEVVEPTTNVPGTDAAVENSATHTTPLFDSDAQLGNHPSHTTPLIDSDTPPTEVTPNAPDPSTMDTETARTVAGKKSFEHNMEVQ
jgi:hypothetical protein